jgi:PAS domain S-box-containing protein
MAADEAARERVMVGQGGEEGLPGEPAIASGRRGWLAGRRAVALGLLMTLVAIGVQGWIYWGRLDAVARKEAENHLSAVADLKVREIAQWRTERLRDATYIHRTPYAARRALDALVQPESATNVRMFTSWLTSLVGHGDYDRILLLDGDLKTRVAFPGKPPPVLAEPVRRAAEEALRIREVVVADLHRAADDEPIRMGLVVPFVVRREGTNDVVPAAGASPSATARARAVLVLEANPEQFLYPLVRSWPAPSRSAETVLVRREGNDVVVLNEVRHRTNTALRLRVPAAAQDQMIARAVRTPGGTLEGPDYRGVPVLAAFRRVPDSPWFLLAKADTAEVYAPWRRLAGTIALSLALLAAVCFLAAALLWRRHTLRLLRHRLASEQARAAMAERVSLLMRNANDIILLLDERWRVAEANDQALRAYGYSEVEIRGLPMRDLYAPEGQARFDADSRQVDAGQGVMVETVHRRRDGTSFPVESSVHRVVIEGRALHQAIVRDVSVRKAHELEIERLDRLYVTLSEVNQAILRAGSMPNLFEAIVKVAVESGRFHSAWIGMRRQEGTDLECVARYAAASGVGFLPPDPTQSCRLAAEALRSGSPSLGSCPCWESGSKADPNGTASGESCRGACAAVPFGVEDRVCGLLAVCTSNRERFSVGEMRLLGELALDISHALHRLREQELRRQTEEALRLSEERLRLATEAAQMGTWDRDVQTGRLHWSPQQERLMGYEPGTFPGTAEVFLELLDPGSREAHAAAQTRARAGDGVFAAELRFRCRDGRERWGLVRGRTYFDAAGRPERIVGIDLDITERKRTEEALRTLVAEQAALLKEVHHRVKNNLQVVASLLSLQARRVRNPVVLGALRDTQDRIRSMALLHETLYRKGEAAQVDCAAYLGRLCTHLSQAFSLPTDRVRLEPSLATVALGIDEAIPCGLIVNELVSNALKHAFPGERHGRVGVRLEIQPGERLALTVADDGVGLPAGFDLGSTSTLGLELVRGLTRQVGGSIEVLSPPGTTVRIVFPFRPSPSS